MKKEIDKHFELTIRNLMRGEGLSVQDIFGSVVENLMKVERELYLQENPDNKGNGFYERFVSNLSGKLSLRVPRDRQGQFSPFMLEVLKNDRERLDALALKLYSHGVSQRGIQDIFGEVFGPGYSPAQISSLVKEFEPIRLNWQARQLEKRYHAILIDALYINVRRDTVAKEAVYVVMGLKEDLTRDVLGLWVLPTESAAGWESILKEIKKRGVERIGLFLCDELSGIEGAINTVFPASHVQFCLVHKMRSVLSAIRPGDKANVSEDLAKVFDLDLVDDTPEKFIERLEQFLGKWEVKYRAIRNKFRDGKRELYCSYLKYPFGVRRMLYTTNWIERLNKEIRKVTKHVNSFPSDESLLNLVFMAVAKVVDGTYSYPISNFQKHINQLEEILG